MFVYRWRPVFYHCTAQVFPSNDPSQRKTKWMHIDLRRPWSCSWGLIYRSYFGKGKFDEFVRYYFETCVAFLTALPFSMLVILLSPACRWQTGSFGNCSKACGGGLMNRNVRCVRQQGEGETRVPESQCSATEKPPVQMTCNRKSCPGVWWSGTWSAVSIDWPIYLIWK